LHIILFISYGEHHYLLGKYGYPTGMKNYGYSFYFNFLFNTGLAFLLGAGIIPKAFFAIIVFKITSNFFKSVAYASNIYCNLSLIN
jgi:hypothetical protein